MVTARCLPADPTDGYEVKLGASKLSAPPAAGRPDLGVRWVVFCEREPTGCASKPTFSPLSAALGARTFPSTYGSSICSAVYPSAEDARATSRGQARAGWAGRFRRAWILEVDGTHAEPRPQR